MPELSSGASVPTKPPRAKKNVRCAVPSPEVFRTPTIAESDAPRRYAEVSVA
jgi:hypothetical protein